MSACCQWCLCFVKAPEDYNRAITRLYCSKHCLEKDWLFNRWQNDVYLNHIAERFCDGQG